jgi:hypothetical protein
VVDLIFFRRKPGAINASGKEASGQHDPSIHVNDEDIGVGKGLVPKEETEDR